MKTGTLYIHMDSDAPICLQVVQGRLCGILEPDDCERGLYIGRISSINNSLGAAFVDIGEEKNGFLPLEKGHGLKCGQVMLVNKTKAPRDGKGPQVTDKITLSGNLICLTTNVGQVSVSSKIEDLEKVCYLKEIGDRVLCEIGKKFAFKVGIILRTMSSEADPDSIISEGLNLAKTMEGALGQLDTSAVPGPVEGSANFLQQVIGTMITPEIQEIVVDSHQAYCDLSDVISRVYPGKISIRKYDYSYNMMEYYNLNSMIRHSLGHKVLLSCGGSIVIDKTEAMTVIDVNSGKGSLSPEMIINTNLEACQEIAAQLKLRRIGGIIVVDFINMTKEQQEIVMARLREATASDKAVTGIYGFSKLGLVEIARSRIMR